MAQITKNLLIGLGGTGQKILLEAKASMLNQFGSVPSNIRFLAFDTDVPDEASRDIYTGKKIEFEGAEFVRLSGDGAYSVAKEAEGSWWPEGCTDWPLPGAGAAAKRMHGRAKLGLNINKVQSYIQSAITEVKSIGEEGVDKHAEGKIRVFIACSLAGGTGAGCWLDIANLVHEHINPNDRVVGLMLLGDAFESLPGTTNKYANTVACLRELQWLLEKPLHPDNPYFNYKLYHRKMSFPKGKIFNSCFLASKTIDVGVADEHESMMLALGRWLFHMCGPAGDEFDRREHNVSAGYPYTTPGTKGQTPKMGVFWSLGISELIYEANTENLILAEDYSIQCLSNMLSGTDTEDPENYKIDVNAFLNTNNLQEYDADQVIDALWPPIDTERLVEKFKDPPIDQIERTSSKVFYKKWRSACIKFPETAKDKAEKAKKQILENTSKVFRAKLEDLITKPGGVNRARSFFKQLQKDLKSQEEMMREESEENQSDAKNKEQFLKKIADQHEQNKPGPVFWRNRIADQVSGLLPHMRQWLKQSIDSKRKDVAADLYQSLQIEAGNIVDQTQRLEDNIETASTSLKKAAAQRSRHIKSNFRREVKRPADDQGVLKKDAITRKFLALKLKQLTGEWVSHECDPDTIRDETLEFISGELKQIADTDISNVIMRGGPEQLKHNIRDIYQRSAPLWKYDKGIIAQCEEHETPHSALVTAGASTMPEEINKVLIKESGTGAIPGWVPVEGANYFTLMQWEYNVPAFAIECVKRQMIREYNNENLWIQNPVGFHLHCEWREEIPTIEPDSSQEQRKEVWVLAMARELIEETTSTYKVTNTIELGSATPTGEFSVSLGTKIHQEAKRKFIDNKTLCEDVAGMIGILMYEEGASQFYSQILDYRSNSLGPKIRNSGMQTERQDSLNEDLIILNKWIDKRTEMGDGGPPPRDTDSDTDGDGAKVKDPQTA